MSTIEIRVPDIGDFKDVEVVEVHVAPGAEIKPEDPLITLESDKASMEVPSPAGGTAFTPLVNAPEVAILGVVRARMAPVWKGESFEPRLMLPVSVSYDHRVIDGALAARFARHLCHVLEDVRRLVL